MSSRTKAQLIAIETRRNRVASLYCEGKPQSEIAKLVAASEPTISRDIAAIKTEWRTQRADEVQSRLFAELAKIDHLERESWEAYHKSKSPLIETKSEASVTADKKTENEKVVRIVRERLPETNFLDQVRWCIEQRCKILGLLAPTKVAPTNVDGTESYKLTAEGMSDAEIEAFTKAASRIANAVPSNN